jgi:hypothetical protein
MKSLTHCCCKEILKYCTDLSVLFLFSCNLASHLDTLIAHCAREPQLSQYGVPTVRRNVNLLQSRQNIISASNKTEYERVLKCRPVSHVHAQDDGHCKFLPPSCVFLPSCLCLFLSSFQHYQVCEVQGSHSGVD